MTNKEIAIAAVKEGIIKPTLISAYAFIDAWSYLLFGKHPERLDSRGIYECIRPSYMSYKDMQEVRRMADGEDRE